MQQYDDVDWGRWFQKFIGRVFTFRPSTPFHSISALQLSSIHPSRLTADRAVSALYLTSRNTRTSLLHLFCSISTTSNGEKLQWNLALEVYLPHQQWCPAAQLELLHTLHYQVLEINKNHLLFL